MMEPYKYCDWHRVREQGIIFLSVLQKELEAIMKLVSAIFETKKKTKKNIHTMCRWKFHNQPRDIVDAKNLGRFRKGLGKVMGENQIRWIRKAKSYRLLDNGNQENYLSLYACPSFWLFCGQLVLATVGDRVLHFAHWLHAATTLLYP